MGILNDEQERIKNAAVNWFFKESEQVFQIAGAAGTGKTFLMYEILKSIGLTPAQYMAMAYTGQASIIMRTRGFKEARSIHSSLYEVIEIDDLDNIHKAFGIPKKKKKFVLRHFLDPNIKLLFIDEAFMVPRSMVRDILSFGIKTIVCGDPNQLPPVADDPAFLVSGNVHRLTQLMRQAEMNPIVYIANRVLNDLPIHCGVYGSNLIVITEDDLTPDILNYSDCICCGTNKTRETMNNYIRDLRGYKSNFPTIGERVICRQNNWNITLDGIALCNGLSGTVVSPADISKYDGNIFKIDFKPDLINGYFCDLECNKDYFLAPYSIKQEMKSMGGNEYTKGEFFEYSYCLTTHLCQGSEYNQGVYLEEFIRPQMQKALNYTGITRFKNKLIYVKKAKRLY